MTKSYIILNEADLIVFQSDDIGLTLAKFFELEERFEGESFFIQYVECENQ